MSAQRVADMTLDELKEFVEEIVDRHVHKTEIPSEFDSVDAINDFIDRHRWTPPPGSPSNLELIREDRNR
jgi:hypothetical protein